MRKGLCTGRAEHLVVIQEMLPGCINPVSLDLYNSTPQLNETEKISRVYAFGNVHARAM